MDINSDEISEETLLPGNDEKPSGKFVLRIPKSIHEKLIQRANEEGVSLNTVLVCMIAYCLNISKTELEALYLNLNTCPEEELTKSNKAEQPSRFQEVTIAVDSKIWEEFKKTYAQWYRSRKKHTKGRPSYARLQQDAINAALYNYTEKFKQPPSNL